ncbi:unnamed protein product, partial [Staurois parvus]
KHDSTTALLTSQPCWNRVAIHQPSTTPSIWTIQGCMALISEQDCLKISLHVFFCPMQPFLLVSIAALLIRCMDLAEIFLNVPSSESATNLLIVRRSRLSFQEISNVFIPRPRH